jgi:hypothetical protein
MATQGKGNFMPRRRHSVVIRLISFLALTWSFMAHAKDATVFDVRRPIAMENDEKPPKDFYINAGANDGLKSGMIVTVQRRQSLYDPYQNKSPGDLVVTVGQLRLIHVQGDMSVARLENIEGRQNLPTIEFEAIMVGDKVDLNSAKMVPRKTASLDIQLLPVEMLKTSEGSQESASLAPAPVASPAPVTSTTN